MTKKDYKAIASAIKYATVATNKSDRLFKSLLIVELCKIMASDNPNFNEATFKAACE